MKFVAFWLVSDGLLVLLGFERWAHVVRVFVFFLEFTILHSTSVSLIKFVCISSSGLLHLDNGTFGSVDAAEGTIASIAVEDKGSLQVGLFVLIV